jgi:peptidoglycan pentaglycine glycine transferase (the first glycine)
MMRSVSASATPHRANPAYETVLNPEPAAWEHFVAAHPASHILQTAAWGALKAQFGWHVERIALADGGKLVAGAQVLYRRLPLGLGLLAYVPRGPVVEWHDGAQVSSLLAAAERAAQARGAFALMLEPDLPDGQETRTQLSSLGFAPAPLTIQPPRTIVVDLTGDEDQLLARMKQKTRYNLRLAERKGVTVREATLADLPTFHALMQATAERDDFGVHSPAYYEAAYRLFVPSGRACLLLAEVAGEPTAAVMVFALGQRAWYFYGASGPAHREKMSPYLLQWEAMRWARTQGCTSYDLWGIPDEDEQTLEAQFSGREDGLWGVYRFKRGFGGQVVRRVGAWERAFSPLRYRAYRWLVRLRRKGLSS